MAGDRITDEEVRRVANRMSVSVYTDDDIKTLACLGGVLNQPGILEDFLIQYPNDGRSGTPQEWAASIRSRKPHWFKAVEIDDGIDEALIERAFGAKPTMFARGDLRNLVGPDTYNQLMIAWGASERTLAPGKNPKTGVTDASASGKGTKAERGEDQSTNPWHPSFVGDRNKAIATFIGAFGTPKSQAMAKACGVDIAGRPLSAVAHLRRA